MEYKFWVGSYKLQDKIWSFEVAILVFQQPDNPVILSVALERIPWVENELKYLFKLKVLDEFSYYLGVSFEREKKRLFCRWQPIARETCNILQWNRKCKCPHWQKWKWTIFHCSANKQRWAARNKCLPLQISYQEPALHEYLFHTQSFDCGEISKPICFGTDLPYTGVLQRHFGAFHLGSIEASRN